MLLGYQPDWPARLSIAIGVAKGLAFLHHLAIIHLDISSSNVLLDADFKPLIGDIEISEFLDSIKGSTMIIPYVGSSVYVPPGILLSGIQLFHIFLLQKFRLD